MNSAAKMNQLSLYVFAYGFSLFTVYTMVNCLPVLEKDGTNTTNLQSSFQLLHNEILESNTPSRITKLFQLKNSTETKGRSELSKYLFSALLKEIGWNKIENVVPMYWTEIVSIRSKHTAEKSRMLICDQIFHPDHFLSNVILENLISSKTISEEQFTNSLKHVFCSKSMRRASLHFVQSDDVISGIVILSFQKDSSILALVNVGF